MYNLKRTYMFKKAVVARIFGAVASLRGDVIVNERTVHFSATMGFRSWRKVDRLVKRVSVKPTKGVAPKSTLLSTQNNNEVA